MPFQSEKQRRYLWANEPEIARDWTDTYGSRIQKNDGGIMHHFQNYAQNDGNNVSVPRSFQARPQSEQVNLAYITPQEQQMLQALKPGTPHRGPMEIPNYDSFDAAGGYSNPDTGYSASSGGGGGGWQDSGRADAKKNEMAEQVRRNYVNKENIKSSPLHNRGLSFTGSGVGPKIGNWASGLAGSKVGGGLGGMLFGPIGMLLGSLFGQGVGRRAYKASQTDEKETAKDILLGQNTLLSNLFNKRKTPTTTDEGLGGIDLSDMRDKRSAKDYIDLDKSYSEFDTIPSAYKGANLAKFISNKKDFPLHGKVVGDWDKGLGDFEYEQPEEWSTQDFPVRSDFYPGIKTTERNWGTGNMEGMFEPEISWSDTRW